MSAAFTTAFAPKVGQDVDALGIGGGSYTSSEDDEENDFDAADLFSIEVEDEGGEMTEMFAGEGLTSMILREDEHGNSQDWASELLLLTHEPMRCVPPPRHDCVQFEHTGDDFLIERSACAFIAHLSLPPYHPCSGATCSRCSAPYRPSILASYLRGGASAPSSASSPHGAASSPSSMLLR